MVSHTVYFKGMMVFTLTSQMYHRISVLVPVLVQVPEYLSTSTSTMTLELTSTSTVRVPEIQYASTASTSTEYEYPSPDGNPYILFSQDKSYFELTKVILLSFTKDVPDLRFVDKTILLSDKRHHKLLFRAQASLTPSSCPWPHRAVAADQPPMNTPQGQQCELSSDGCADFNAWLESDLVLIINFNSTHR